MKVIETLTTTEITQMINDTSIVGIFKEAIKPEDAYYNECGGMCKNYYISHSGLKTVSPTYKFVSEFSNNPNAYFGLSLRARFIDKWTRIYNALYIQQYDVLDNTRFMETHIEDTADKRDKSSRNTGVTTVTSEDNGSSSNTDSSYGFNSSEAVPANTSDNKTTNNSKNNTNTSNTTTENDTGSRKSTVTRENHGSNISGAEAIQKELNLRNRETFYDIVFKDIDSVFTTAIYNY